MNRIDWDNWRIATGVRKQKLLTQIVAEHKTFIERACAFNLRQTQYNTTELRADAMQAAHIGFIRAVTDWEPERGRFAVVAYGWIRHEIQQVLRDATPVTRPKSADLPRKVQNAAAKFYAKNGREPTPEEIGVTETAVARAQKAQAKFVPMQIQGQDDFHGMLVDRADPELRCEAFAEGPETAIDRERDLKALRTFLRKLSPAERKTFWSGKDEGLTARAKEYVESRREGPRST